MANVDADFIGTILGEKVISYEKQICEAGQTGLTTLILNIVYEGPAEGKPSSIAIKTHAESQDVRNLAKLGKLYAKECYYYSTFRKNCPKEFNSPEPIAVFQDGDEFFMLIMENINDAGWIAYDSGSNMATYDDILLFVSDFTHAIHVPFANKKLECPFACVGALDEYEVFLRNLPTTFPVWKEGFATSLAFDNESLFGKRGANGLPEAWSTYFAAYEMIIAQPEKFIQNVNKVFASRPQTLSHGDLNTGNIRYRVNKDGKKEFLFHDFQFFKQGTLGSDFVTLFCTVPEIYIANGQDIKIMQLSLDIIKKEYKGEFNYTLQMCIDDFCLFSLAFLALIVSLMTGQFAQRETIPPEKFAYAWNVLYPFGYDWGVKATMRHDVVGLVKKVIDGTYKY
jgi:hypothetical protein